MTTDVLGRPFVASKQAPLDRLAVLRRAFDATTKDAQFLAEAEKLNLPLVDPVSGPDAEKIIGHFMPLRLRWSPVHRRWWRSSKPP